jgi:hypothetical protein
VFYFIYPRNFHDAPLKNGKKITPANLTNAIEIKVHEFDNGTVILLCNVHSVFSETMRLHGCRTAWRGMKLVSVAGGMRRLQCLPDTSRDTKLQRGQTGKFNKGKNQKLYSMKVIRSVCWQHFQ